MRKTSANPESKLTTKLSKEEIEEIAEGAKLGQAAAKKWRAGARVKRKDMITPIVRY